MRQTPPIKLTREFKTIQSGRILKNAKNCSPTTVENGQQMLTYNGYQGPGRWCLRCYSNFFFVFYYYYYHYYYCYPRRMWIDQKRQPARRPQSTHPWNSPNEFVCPHAPPSYYCSHSYSMLLGLRNTGQSPPNFGLSLRFGELMRLGHREAMVGLQLKLPWLP